MFLSFSEFVTYPVMSSDLPALKKTHLKSTVHGDGNILYSSLLLFCRTARSVSVTVPLTAFVSLAFPLSLSRYDFTAVQEKKKPYTEFSSKWRKKSTILHCGILCDCN